MNKLSWVSLLLVMVGIIIITFQNWWVGLGIVLIMVGNNVVIGTMIKDNNKEG